MKDTSTYEKSELKFLVYVCRILLERNFDNENPYNHYEKNYSILSDVLEYFGMNRPMDLDLEFFASLISLNMKFIESEEKLNSKQLENINKFPLITNSGNSLNEHISPNSDRKYYYTQCAELQKFINNFDDIINPNINSCLINKYPSGENFIAPHRDCELSFGNVRIYKNNL